MLVTEMGKFEDIVLYKKLRQGKIKLYTAIAAQDFFDKKKVNMDSLYFEENIIDETDNIIPKIQYYIRQIIAENYITIININGSNYHVHFAVRKNMKESSGLNPLIFVKYR